MDGWWLGYPAIPWYLVFRELLVRETSLSKISHRLGA